MRRILILLLIINWSCSTVDRYEIFDINNLKNYQLISLDTINDIETFNTLFWSMDSFNNEMSFVIKFDFETGEFSNKSSKGVKLEGMPYECLIFDCRERNTLRLYLTEDYQIMDSENEVLSEIQVKSLVKDNILNYGKDPTLSDSPEDAVISIFLTTKQQIDRIGKPLKHIIDGYLEILTHKNMETKESIGELALEFPLNIQLRRVNPTPLIDSGYDNDEIEEDIKLDTTMY